MRYNIIYSNDTVFYALTFGESGEKSTFARSNESVTLLIGHVVPNSRDDKRGTSDKSDIHRNDKRQRNVSQTLHSLPPSPTPHPALFFPPTFPPC